MLDTKPFKWNAELGIARYKNEISALPDGDYTTEILGGEVLTAVGHPAGVFYGYEAHGVYATEAEAQAARLKVQHEDASYTYFHAGDVRFADLHADGVLDERDKTIIGDPNPLISRGRLPTVLRWDVSLWMCYARSNAGETFITTSVRHWRA